MIIENEDFQPERVILSEVSQMEISMYLDFPFSPSDQTNPKTDLDFKLVFSPIRIRLVLFRSVVKNACKCLYTEIALTTLVI